MSQIKVIGVMPFKEGDHFIFIETEGDHSVSMEYTVVSMDTFIKYLTLALRRYNRRITRKKGH